IAQILKEQNLLAEETMFIGDMQHDVETAHAGGIHSCAVLTGYNSRKQLEAAEPELIVEHLGELGEMLKESGMVWPAPVSANE
ncbi:MAG: HAD hydrolase-like protein, partial [Verrucomicrobiales bacterium]|nr:HAD hydrolase-like protein [Verrucomicrobiales bacterium]